ncbi:thioredoxin fold domain-containing protein [Oceaniferula spumae]|uniref:thioredoxin fold domain-containing protein n=1 Tax=Oceaniferula spumae TaxID=2979115 RepID=UPI003F4E54DC
MLSLVSCAQLGEMVGGKDKKKTADGEKPMTGLEAYQRAGGRVAGLAGVTGGAAATARVSPTAAGITPDEDIHWAPENPDVPMGGGMEELWKQPENKSWHISYTEAIRHARESGKPILIWFTDSARSPLCRALNDELFSNSGFDSWAGQRIVRLRVDDQIKADTKHENEWTKKRNYIDGLKKRYKVLGHPTVLILSPRGAVVAQYRGYKKGTPDYYWGRIKSSVSKAENDYGAWREKLEKRGYRLWTNRKGRKTLAKLHRFSSGKVTLIDPDGKRGTTTFNKLSDDDQTWIMQEKKKYDARHGR